MVANATPYEPTTVVVDADGTVTPLFAASSRPSTRLGSSAPSVAASLFSLKRGVLIAVAALAALIVAPAGQPARGDGLVEVVVTMEAPPIADAIARSRVLTGRVKAQRLDLRTPTSIGYLASLATAQHALASRITTSIPASRITWQYRVVLDGLAVLLPAPSSAGSARRRGSSASGPTSPTGRCSIAAPV